MNLRLWLGPVLWVVGFNFCVALVALDLGIGWAIAILCVRHILLSIPVVFGSWSKLLIGSKIVTKFAIPPSADWPNRKWLIESLLCLIFSLVMILWLNYPVRSFFK